MTKGLDFSNEDGHFKHNTLPPSSSCALLFLSKCCVSVDVRVEETPAVKVLLSCFPEHEVCPLVRKALLGTFPNNKQAYEENKAEPKLIMDF